MKFSVKLQYSALDKYFVVRMESNEQLQSLFVFQLRGLEFNSTQTSSDLRTQISEAASGFHEHLPYVISPIRETIHVCLPATLSLF